MNMKKFLFVIVALWICTAATAAVGIHYQARIQKQTAFDLQQTKRLADLKQKRDAALAKLPTNWKEEEHMNLLIQFFDALQFVETGNGIMVGDGGNSIGPYQISEAYWIDAELPGEWADCFDKEYAQSVMLSYWKRYCPAALRDGNWEVLARTHNGGPNGMSKQATVKYWQKVKEHMK